MSGDVYFQNILGTVVGSLGVFETAFRIFISICVISESAVDSVHLISQTEVILNSDGMKMMKVLSHPSNSFLLSNKNL